LVQGVSADPVADAQARLERLAKHPAQAYRATKLDLRSGIMEASSEQKAAFRDQVVPFWTSPEIKALIRSLLGN
jgi:enoyl-CoA hydratase/carnithine racemase